MTIKLYNKTSIDCSRRIALNYSTSFSLGIRLLGEKHRDSVFAIYGLVRVADEIVDTFLNHDRRAMLLDFEKQTYDAIRLGISTNPVLNAFQYVAKKYNIGEELIDPFFRSMEEDLDKSEHSEHSYSQYIYGSAEVVGLMCLKVFCQGRNEQYNALKPAAQRLGAAFQKVNFLRDIQSDFMERGRLYFPGVSFHEFTEESKAEIIKDIKKDFEKAYEGIKILPFDCRLGVHTAYIYYLKLLQKIEHTPASKILNQRVRIKNSMKFILLAKSFIKERGMQNVAF